MNSSLAIRWLCNKCYRNTVVSLLSKKFTSRTNHIPLYHQRLYVQAPSHPEKDESRTSGVWFENENDFLLTDEANIPGYKDLQITVPTLKLLDVLQAGFCLQNVDDAEDYFYESRVRVNRSIPKKKVVKVHENDVVDVISEVNEQVVKIHRIAIIKFELNKKERYNILIRRWLKPIEMLKL